MSVVEIALTAEQLAAAYTQLSDEERRSFLEAIFDHPAHQQAALELLIEARYVLRRKFPPANNDCSIGCWTEMPKESYARPSANGSSNWSMNTAQGWSKRRAPDTFWNWPGARLRQNASPCPLCPVFRRHSGSRLSVPRTIGVSTP